MDRPANYKPSTVADLQQGYLLKFQTTKRRPPTPEHALAEELWEADSRKSSFMGWYKLIKRTGYKFMREEWQRAQKDPNIRNPIAYIRWAAKANKPTLTEYD